MQDFNYLIYLLFKSKIYIVKFLIIYLINWVYIVFNPVHLIYLQIPFVLF